MNVPADGGTPSPTADGDVPAAPDDPRYVIGASAISGYRIRAVAVIVGLNALDGVDVLSMSFAAGLATQWNIDRGALGVVLSMGLVGMGVGSLALSPLADLFGRRPAMLACLTAMAAGMFVTAAADSLAMLSLGRVLTGLGIGANLATINAVTAELANDRRRDLSIAFVANEYPIGAVLGGSLSAWLLSHHDWRAVSCSVGSPPPPAFLSSTRRYRNRSRSFFSGAQGTASPG